MKILFLDQSGKLGGAELSLLDVAKLYQHSSLVGLFSEGDFQRLLEQQSVPVQILLKEPIRVSRNSNLLQGLGSLGSLVPLVLKVAKIARDYDLIYANTQKALVVGAIASYISRRPLVYHLRDILSTDHFSQTNIQLIVTLTNRLASLVIANSEATKAAFIASGGRSAIVKVVYNGFKPEDYKTAELETRSIRKQLGLVDRFVVGHFSRLSPWKGQHVLIEALKYCPDDVTAILVGDALFGEQEYVKQLHQQVEQLGLSDRVHFLGFRSDIPALMSACDLIAHTSTAPEPFGRVIVEGMLCSRPVVVAAAGGALELVKHGKTGWFTPPGDARKLAEIICICRDVPAKATAIAHQAQSEASEQFHIAAICQQIDGLLQQLIYGDQEGNLS